MLAGQTIAIDKARLFCQIFTNHTERNVVFISQKEHLASHNDAGARHIEFLDSFAQDTFTLTIGIDVGSVKKVDAGIISLAKKLERFIFVFDPRLPLGGAIGHAADGETRNLCPQHEYYCTQANVKFITYAHTSLAQANILHLREVFRSHCGEMLLDCIEKKINQEEETYLYMLADQTRESAFRTLLA